MPHKMSRPSSRLLATTASRIPSSLRQSLQSGSSSRPFSQTCTRTADTLLSRMRQPSQQTSQQGQSTGPPRSPSAPASSSSPPSSTSSSAPSRTSDLGRILTTRILSQAQNQSMSDEILSGSSYDVDFVNRGGGLDGGDAGATSRQFQNLGPPHEPFHFHVYAHKHNCHITVTKPNRGAIVNLSAGNIGFRKAKRGTYDAAYQLTAYVMDKLNQGGWHRVIRRMEVVLRGFGTGREAATKVLLGAEGKMLRDAIVKVSDATKLKFGGTRSPKPRRLG